jgi:hypothetical protein
MGALKTNIKHQVKQTPLPKWKPLIPLFEAVMNSIQSIKEATQKNPGNITIDIHREHGLFTEEYPPIEGFTITDDGVGLTDDNFDSFNTSFSDYKEREGGKGLGRFTWLKAFDVVEIESTFCPPGEKPQRRKFNFTEIYNPDDGVPQVSESYQSGMKVKLIGFREPYKSEFPPSADQLVQRLVEHFLLIFLEPNCPKVVVIDQGKKIFSKRSFREGV